MIWDNTQNLKPTPKKNPISEIKNITKRLDRLNNSFVLSVECLMDDSRDKELQKIKFDLFQICKDIGAISEIFDNYSITRGEFDEIFHKLDALGLARWVGNHYLLTATLTDKKALTYLLSHSKNREIYADSDIEISYNLIHYFKSGTELSKPMPPEVFFMVLYRVKNSALELSHLLGMVSDFNKVKQKEYIDLCHEAYRAYANNQPVKEHIKDLFRAVAELQEIWKSDLSRTTNETYDSAFSPKEGWDKFYGKMYK